MNKRLTNRNWNEHQKRQNEALDALALRVPLHSAEVAREGEEKYIANLEAIVERLQKRNAELKAANADVNKDWMDARARSESHERTIKLLEEQIAELDKALQEEREDRAAIHEGQF